MTFLQLAINGVALGAAYALVALGFRVHRQCDRGG